MLQLREKNASGKEFLKKAVRLRELTRKYDVKFIINDSECNKKVIEHFIDKLNKLNDSIKAKVDD